MQIKIFSIPIIGGEAINEDLNAFLRSKKVVQVESQLVSAGNGAFWVFCVKYSEDENSRQRERIDYREVLDESSFQRFAVMREIRRKLSREESVPAYTIFTDEELAELAKVEELTAAKMKRVKGVGEKKVERYGSYFISKAADETSESPPATDT